MDSLPPAKPTLVSMTITFVKDQFKEGSVMEIMAILDTGTIVQKTVPMDGRTLRVDVDFFSPAPT